MGDSVKKRIINQEAVSLRPALRLPSHHQLTQGWSLQTYKSVFLNFINKTLNFAAAKEAVLSISAKRIKAGPITTQKGKWS